MLDLERLWAAIPVGEENADGASEIWRRYDLGTRATIHQNLK
jgi:hypothetical protein